MELKLLPSIENDKICYINGCKNKRKHWRMKPWGSVGLCRKHYKEEREIEKVNPVGKTICLWSPKRKKGRPAKSLSDKRK